nr:ribonuclease H-like domain-containing protein [Tanacetum cinerariifolium]
MVNCNPSRISVDIESKLGANGDPVSDLTLYRSLAGSLQYLIFTRPNISYAVQQVCLYMHDPRESYLSALKRILRYVQVDIESKLGANGDPVSDLTLYRSLAGSLQYLIFTRPNISYAVQQGTLDYGLHLFTSSTTSLVAYSYADWAGCPTTRR